MYIFRFILFFIFTLIASSILADSHEHHHHDNEEHLFEEHSSHVHGHATAQISYVQGVLNISKTLSSIDVFGFEHAPKNDEQKQIIIQTLKKMEMTENFFSFKNDACELKSTKIKNELIKTDTSDHEDGHEEEHHHDDEESDEKTHTDVTANYTFKCDNNKLESIEFLIFDQFPSLEKIEVQYISEDHPILFNATSSKRILMLN